MQVHKLDLKYVHMLMDSSKQATATASASAARAATSSAAARAAGSRTCSRTCHRLYLWLISADCLNSGHPDCR